MGLVDDHPHTWPVPLRPLEHRDFRRLWLGTFASNAGSWMQRVATGWLVYSLTGSATWLGIDSLASGLPSVLLLPFGGAIADRVDRRWLLVVSNLASALLALGLALFWWAQALTVWHLVAASLLSGVLSAVMVPASQSVLPAVVGDDHLPGAIALNSLQYNVARALGPALGGLALAWAGPGGCFALNALSFLVLVTALLVIREIPLPERPRGSVLANIREGLTFLHGRSDLRRLLLLVVLLAFCGAPSVSMLPALTASVLHTQAGGYSTLLACFGLGAAIVSALLTFVPAKHQQPRWIIAFLMLVGVGQIALGWANSVVMAAGLVLVTGAGFVGAMIEMGTGVIQGTPDAFRGRVSSVQQVVFRAAQPLGGLIAGLLAQHAGAPAAFILLGGILILGGCCLHGWHRQGAVPIP